MMLDEKDIFDKRLFFAMKLEILYIVCLSKNI